MTREEILAKWETMKPWERNKWVAEKVLGWQWHDREWALGPIFEPMLVPPDAVVVGPYPVPKFSEKFDAAWEVFQKMRDGSFSQRSQFMHELQRIISRKVRPPLEAYVIAWPDVMWHIEPADICKASLLSMGVE